jgi:hypothetical protein
MFVVLVNWIPALATLFFTGIGYSVTALVVASRSQPMAAGSAPALVIPFATPPE